MKSGIPIAAICVLGLPLLAGCVTVSQSDLAEAVKASLQPAVDTFFEELEKQTNPAATLVETGYFDVHAPDRDATPPDYVLDYALRALRRFESSTAEPSQDDPPEVWQAWHSRLQSIPHDITSLWRLSETRRSYVDWGFWATLNGEPLFKMTLAGRSPPSACFDPFGEAECIPPLPDQIVSAAEGERTGTNPIAGSAIWAGHARGVAGDGRPRTGTANLEADLGAGLIDVHLTELGPDTLSWIRLVMQDGAFGRVDEEPDRSSLGSSIVAAFYGPNHEGVAGKFTHQGMIGVFGALRE